MNCVNYNKILPILLFWVFCFIYIVALFIGPRVPNDKQEEFCVRNFEVNSIFGHSMNCDSADWILNTNNPSRIIEENSVRQSRPGMIYFTYYLSKFLNSFIENKNYPKKTKFISKDGISINILEEFSPKIVYSSYFLTNLLLLFLSFMIFFKIFDSSIFKFESYQKWYLWISTFIITNNTVNQFLFSPSTKILNIFCTLIGIYYLINAIDKKFSFTNYIFVYLTLGCLLLFYASFFIPFVLLILINLYQFKNKNYLYEILKIFFLISLFLFPYLLWFLYIKHLNNNFYIPSIEEYDFIIWVYKYYKDGGIIMTLYQLLADYYIFIIKFIREHSFLAIFLPIFLFYKKKINTCDKNIYFSSLLFCFFYISFFILLGHKPSDIVSVLIIPIGIIFALFTRNNEANLKNANLTKLYFYMSLIVFNIWSLTKFGPYS